MRRPLAKVRDEPLLAFGLRTELQDALLPEKLQRKPRCDHVGDVFVRSGAKLAWAVAEDQSVAGLVEIVKFAAEAWIGGYWAVFEKVYFSAQQRFVVKEFDDPEGRAADGQNIAAAIRIAFGDFENIGGAADASDSVG